MDMDGVPVCRARSPPIWRSAVAALILVILVSVTAYLATVLWQGQGEEAMESGQRAGVHRHRRDVDDVTEISVIAASTPRVRTETGSAIAEKPGDYFPVYRQVGGRPIDWDSEQMSTDGFDVQSKTDYIDDEDYEDESASSLEKDLEDDYDYTDDDEDGQKTSKSDDVDDETDDLEELIAKNVSSSSPRGKEFADYYSDFDDGQKFDEDEYETAFIKPGLHYGDNVEIFEQVTALLISLSRSLSLPALSLSLFIP